MDLEPQKTPGEIWFDFLVEHRSAWCHGFTYKRLQKVKEHVLSDKYIMEDLLIRHGGKTDLPKGMVRFAPEIFKHAIGNFSCNILYKMRELKIVK